MPEMPDCSAADCPEEWQEFQQKMMQWIIDKFNEQYQDWLDEGNEGSIWDFLWDLLGF